MQEVLQNPSFWVGVSFFIFLAIAFKPAKKAILGALDSKIAEIKDQVEEAARLRDEAQALLAEYERKQQQASKHAEEMVDAARKEAEESKARAEADLNASLDRQRKMALERISMAEEKALREVRAAAAEMAIAATEKLVAERVAGADGDKLVDRAIEELGTKLH
ncbi:F0F1 ATP synthase subunit B [Hwanghaeella sp.]|uniref:F0F1 ATP synthase subunit B family protein n=1 Tax=Hwanghaeella sp. TaxID=2605943 RepID=UPI003CCC3BB6